MTLKRRIGTAMSVATLGLAVSVAPAQAVTIGVTSPPAGTMLGDACKGSAISATQISTDGTFSYLVPAGGGELTSWSYLATGATAGTPYTLIVLRPTGVTNQFTVLATNATEVPNSPNGVVTVPLTTPVAVQAGDQLGITVASTTTVPCTFTAGASSQDIVGVGAPTSTGGLIQFEPEIPAALNVSANLVQSEDVGVAVGAEPAAITVGNDGVFVLSISHSGVGSGPVTVSDSVPAGLSVVSVSGGSGACTVAGRTVSCSLASAPASIAVVVRASAPGSYSDVALVNGALSDPNEANNTASATLKVGAAVGRRCEVVSLTGLPLKSAKTAIKALGCAVGKITSKRSVSVPKGDVISTSPKAGANDAPGTKVAIVESSGKPKKRH
jgi:hypothetical protein